MKHLTLENRRAIERALNEGVSFRQIAHLTNKHPSTISREIRSRRVVSQKKPYGRTINACKIRMDCANRNLCQPCVVPSVKSCRFCEYCNANCPDFEEEVCPQLEQPPYVCNSCSDRRRCTLHRLVYQAETADHHYRESLVDSRSGYCLTGEEFQQIDTIVTPRIQQGQSIYAILSSVNDELPCGESTIYRLIDDGELCVRNIDLPRKVRLKPRKAKKQRRVDRLARVGRTMDDYNQWLKSNDPGPLVEMDTIEGIRGGAVLLSLRWPDQGLHLLFWRQANTARSVQLIFDDLYNTLGHERFTRVFGRIITDNGSEFSNPHAIEFASDGTRRTTLFYCDPGSPAQKASVERGHGECRRFLPKGSSFNDLGHEKTQWIQDHLNSYPTKKLNGASPYATFSALFGDSYAKVLGWRVIDPVFINLTPSLLQD